VSPLIKFCLVSAIMGLLIYPESRSEGTFHTDSKVWSRGLSVEDSGHGVVSHAGLAATRMLADRVRMTGAAVGRAGPAGLRPAA
jgi:hypothetical protein